MAVSSENQGQKAPRVCADCGTPVRAGDGGRRADGRLFCSEECIDSWQDTPEDSMGGEYGY